VRAATRCPQPYNTGAETLPRLAGFSSRLARSSQNLLLKMMRVAFARDSIGTQLTAARHSFLKGKERP
jgi:hypothetical protein